MPVLGEVEWFFWGYFSNASADSNGLIFRSGLLVGLLFIIQ